LKIICGGTGRLPRPDSLPLCRRPVRQRWCHRGSGGSHEFCSLLKYVQSPLSTLIGKRIAAFCGIGNPDSFHRSLLDVGYDISSFRSFPDHHHYSLEELDEIGEWGKQSGALAILVTQKDLVKIKRTELTGLPLWAVRISTRILRGREALESQLQTLLNTNLG